MPHPKPLQVLNNIVEIVAVTMLPPAIFIRAVVPCPFTQSPPNLPFRSSITLWRLWR